MTVIELLPTLLAGCVEMRAVCYYDVVAAVGGRIPDGFVFAHKEDGDAGCEASEGGGCEFWGGG